MIAIAFLQEHDNDNSWGVSFESVLTKTVMWKKEAVEVFRIIQKMKLTALVPPRSCQLQVSITEHVRSRSWWATTNNDEPSHWTQHQLIILGIQYMCTISFCGRPSLHYLGQTQHIYLMSYVAAHSVPDPLDMAAQPISCPVPAFTRSRCAACVLHIIKL